MNRKIPYNRCKLANLQIGNLTYVNSEPTDENILLFRFTRLYISDSLYPLVPILRPLHFDNPTMRYWRNSEMVFAIFYNGYWMDCCHLIWNDLVCWNYGRSFAYQSFYYGISHYCCRYIHSRKGIISYMNAARKWVQVKKSAIIFIPKKMQFHRFWLQKKVLVIWQSGNFMDIDRK